MTINCNNVESISVSKRNSPRHELRNGDVQIKQILKYKYLSSVLTEDGIYDTEIQKRIERSERYIPTTKSITKHGNYVRNREKISELLCNIIPSSTRQWLMGNFLTKNKVTPSHRDVVLQKNTENTMGGAHVGTKKF